MTVKLFPVALALSIVVGVALSAKGVLLVRKRDGNGFTYLAIGLALIASPLFVWLAALPS